ncbi:hypothetical protein IE81DRAFT_368289 [Ceraceosorus guamensis]|uniref:Uncharacterized protein n=1 Tax=Ceraceosorus guamensis TaxID=1522189 RepID=A0A316VVI1_9BASI|nr:hypothetical protein IE81DRAFT_368289 [Ceraceosorus guamensis]PWN40453.1 hypothetical protein IE81DRAFT_368289 [Ceraceosorus guamensis]
MFKRSFAWLLAAVVVARTAALPVSPSSKSSSRVFATTLVVRGLPGAEEGLELAKIVGHDGTHIVKSSSVGSSREQRLSRTSSSSNMQVVPLTPTTPTLHNQYPSVPVAIDEHQRSPLTSPRAASRLQKVTGAIVRHPLRTSFGLAATGVAATAAYEGSQVSRRTRKRKAYYDAYGHINTRTLSGELASSPTLLPRDLIPVTHSAGSTGVKKVGGKVKTGLKWALGLTAAAGATVSAELGFRHWSKSLAEKHAIQQYNKEDPGKKLDTWCERHKRGDGNFQSCWEAGHGPATGETPGWVGGNW